MVENSSIHSEIEKKIVGLKLKMLLCLSTMRCVEIQSISVLLSVYIQELSVLDVFPRKNGRVKIYHC